MPCCLSLTIHAADPPSARPRLKPAADGFPAGHATPEGVACDLARAFIADDAALFTTTCLPAYGEASLQDTYKDFLHGVIESLFENPAPSSSTPLPTDPKSIAKVFAARHLTPPPARPSMARVAFDFQDVMFVDVDAQLTNGEHATQPHAGHPRQRRPMVRGPRAGSLPAAGDGLDDESASTQDFADVYDLER